MNKTIISGTIGLMFAIAQGSAMAAQPADWSKIQPTEITLLYPGVSPMEWMVGAVRIDRVRHGGGRAFTQGDTCLDCHAEETRDMGKKIVSGEKLEPKPIAGKAAFIPVNVQAAHDGSTLYLRFAWKQPAAYAADKMDETNPVKLAFMLDAGKVDMADRSGCWASCHVDSRTMPEGKDDRKKYIKDGSLSGGVFYDLLQWRSGENKGFDGHVADTRVEQGGAALISAEGKLEGDTWSVVFARKFAGGDTDVKLEAGKTYNFGFAIHDNHTAGRFHHVSLGYKLGIDSKADVTATKQ